MFEEFFSSGALNFVYAAAVIGSFIFAIVTLFGAEFGDAFDLDADIEAGGDVAGKFKPADPFVWQRADTAVTWTPDA